MGLPHRHRSAAVAAILVSSWGSAWLAAADKFITQPSQPSQVGTRVTGQLVSDSASTESAVPPASGAGQPTSPETAGQLRWLAPGSAVQAPTQSQRAPSVEAAVPVRTSSSTGWQGPLEFSNPNFTPAASRTVVALPNPNATQNTAGEAGGSQASSPSQGSESAAQPRRVTASLVSSQIIEGRPGTHAGSRAVAPVDAPPGWQAIGEEMSRRIDSCERLLNRQACYSAREEAQVAMLYLVRMLDLMSNQYASEPAWLAACRALEEAEDFSNTQRLTTDSEFLRRIILSHETPVLKDADASALAPLVAAQHYRQYAELRMIEAAQGHPWAAEAIYAIGRTYQAQADSTRESTQQSLRWKAVTLYRGARAIAPYNAVAANQLGYVLLQMDRPLEAREALIAALQIQPAAEPFQNLAEASRRLGDLSGSQWASSQAIALGGGPTPPNPPPTVVEVDPRTFAAMSPYAIGPNSQRVGNADAVNQAAALPSATVR